MNNIRLENVSVTYNNTNVLKKINLQFIEGKTYAIVGPSGCGKTTLLKVIAGFINYDGDVLYNGHNIKDLNKIDPKFYRTNVVKYIEQLPIVFNNLTCKNNIKINFLRNNNLIEWNNILLNKRKIKSKPSKMSGGEVKRLQLIDALNRSCEIVLADEPTSSLDKIHSERSIQILKEYCKNKILIVVTHNEEIAKHYADEIISLHDGKTQKNYSKKEKQTKISSSKVGKIKFRKYLHSSINYLFSERKISRLLISSFAIISVCLNVIFSIFYGIKNNLYSQLKLDDQETSILLEKYIEEKPVTNNNIEKLENFININNIYKEYHYNDEYINCNLGGELLSLPSKIFTTPPKEYQEYMSNNDIILGFDKDTLSMIENMLNLDTIYDLKTPIELFVEIGDTEHLLNVIKFQETQECSLFHSNNHLNELLFDGYDYNAFLKCTDEETINFINSTTNYCFNNIEGKYYVFETSDSLVSKSELYNNYTNVIPIYKNSDSFIKYYNGLLYFNNFIIKHQNNYFNEVVLYNPYKLDLILGRHPESNNEISISNELYKKLDLEIGDEIEAIYNNITVKLMIVGVVSYDGNCIGNSPTFLHYLEEKYCFVDYNKTNTYIITCNAGDCEQLCSQIKNKYENCNVSSTVYDVISSITKICKFATNICISILSVLSIIIIISSIYLGKLEVASYSKQIMLLKNNGYSNKEINNICFLVFIIRGLISLILSTIISFIIVQIINNMIFCLLNIENLLLINYKTAIYSSVLIFIMSFTAYLFNKIKEPL